MRSISGVNDPKRNRLTREEETFLQALLWEEGHLIKGPATRLAEEHGLSLIRCLEPANRLSPNLQGEALAKLQEGPCPAFIWPWNGLEANAVLKLLWDRLVPSILISENAVPTARN